MPMYLKTSEAAVYLSLSKQRLDSWRCCGNGPKYVKVGALVRYRVADLDAFMAERVVSSTSEYGRATDGN